MRDVLRDSEERLSRGAMPRDDGKRIEFQRSDENNENTACPTSPYRPKTSVQETSNVQLHLTRQALFKEFGRFFLPSFLYSLYIYLGYTCTSQDSPIYLTSFLQNHNGKGLIKI